MSWGSTFSGGRPMSRFLSASLAAIAAAALVACSDAPVSPGSSSSLPQTLRLGVSQDDQEDVVPGEILVKLKDDADLAPVAKGKALEVGKKGLKGAFVVLKGKPGSEVADAEDLKKDPRVEWA